MTRSRTANPLSSHRFAAGRRSLLLACSLVLGSGIALGAGVPVDEANWAAKNEAKREYAAGTGAFEKRELEAALTHFRKSYDVVASPNSHLMIAKVLIEMGRNAEAYGELGGVLQEVAATEARDKYAETASAAEALRKELEAKVAFVTVPVPARVAVRGQEVPITDWGKPLALDAGAAAVEITPRAGEKRTEQVTLAAGKTLEVDPQPPPPPPPVSPAAPCPEVPSAPPQQPGMVRQRAVGWAVGGVGIAGLAAFGVLTAVNDRAYRDLDSDCEGGDCSRETTDAAAHDRALQAYANAGLGVGIAGVATGLLLVVTAPRRPSTAGRSRPALVVTPTGLAVVGSYR